MRRSWITLTALGMAIALVANRAPAADGQGPVDDDVRIEGVNLGTYWFGAKVNKEDLRGKVVLIEQWGS